jgi:hypothetical protein
MQALLTAAQEARAREQAKSNSIKLTDRWNEGSYSDYKVLIEDTPNGLIINQAFHTLLVDYINLFNSMEASSLDQKELDIIYENDLFDFIDAIDGSVKDYYKTHCDEITRHSLNDLAKRFYADIVSRLNPKIFDMLKEKMNEMPYSEVFNTSYCCLEKSTKDPRSIDRIIPTNPKGRKKWTAHVEQLAYALITVWRRSNIFKEGSDIDNALFLCNNPEYWEALSAQEAAADTMKQLRQANPAGSPHIALPVQPAAAAASSSASDAAAASSSAPTQQNRALRCTNVPYTPPTEGEKSLHDELDALIPTSPLAINGSAYTKTKAFLMAEIYEGTRDKCITRAYVKTTGQDGDTDHFAPFAWFHLKHSKGNEETFKQLLTDVFLELPLSDKEKVEYITNEKRGPLGIYLLSQGLLSPLFNVFNTEEQKETLKTELKKMINDPDNLKKLTALLTTWHSASETCTSIFSLPLKGKLDELFTTSSDQEKKDTFLKAIWVHSIENEGKLFADFDDEDIKQVDVIAEQLSSIDSAATPMEVEEEGKDGTAADSSDAEEPDLKRAKYRRAPSSSPEKTGITPPPLGSGLSVPMAPSPPQQHCGPLAGAGANTTRSAGGLFHFNSAHNKPPSVSAEFRAIANGTTSTQLGKRRR